MDILSFLKQSTLVHIWLWCIFVISALIVVAMQCCALVVIWPFSRRWYRDVNGELLKLFWFQYAWLADHWSGSELFLHCKDEDFPFAGREDCLFVLNHRSDVDWIIIWQLAARFNLLPGGKAFMKDELKYVPIIGWSFYLSEQIFVKRNYAKDRESLLKQLRNITTYHIPTTVGLTLLKWWRNEPVIGLVIFGGADKDEMIRFGFECQRSNWTETIIFCEGTRYTEKKYKLSQAFAKERGIPGLIHHLLPRTKGFAMCVQAYRGKNVHIYDGTLAYKGGKAPSLYDLLCGKKYECHMYARRFPLDDVPSDAEDEFCHEMYRGKDKALDYFLKHDSFVGFDAERTMHGFSLPRLPLYIMTGWILVVGLPILYYTYTIAISGSILKVLITSAVLVGIIQFSRFIMTVTRSTESSSYGLKDKAR